jgi:hypothetical protein
VHPENSAISKVPPETVESVILPSMLQNRLIRHESARELVSKLA